MAAQTTAYHLSEDRLTPRLTPMGTRPEQSNRNPSDSELLASSQAALGKGKTPDNDLLTALLDRIKAQEARIASLERGRKVDSDSSTRQEYRTEVSDEPDDYGSGLGYGQGRFIAEVRKCNITEFKNRFDINEVQYAVDVLESTYLLDQEIQDELKIRQSPTKLSFKDKHRGSYSSGKAPTTFLDQAIHTKQSDAKWISRIRIQSPAILSIMSKIVRESWNSQPRTFFRPFSLLIYLHQEIKDTLKDLEAKWGPLHAPEGGEAVESDGSKDAVDDSPQAFAELSCYVKFMEESLLPLYHKFDDLDDSSNANVRFHDLWFLFRAGEHVYQPIAGRGKKESHNVAIRQRPWRTYGTEIPWPKYRTLSASNRKYLNEDELDDANAAFTIYCYYIDYTGDEFCAVTDKFEIQPFEGERPIDSLLVYPWRFVPKHEETLKQSIEDGKRVLNFLQTRHGAYDWWTMTRDPRGEPAVDVEGEIAKRPEHINSEVIVDFIEAFQICPAWKPKRSVLKAEEPKPSTTADEFYTCWWSDVHRSKLLAETTEIIMLRTGVTTYERNRAIQDDEFLTSVRENDRLGKPTTAKHLRDSDLALLPLRVFAYSLQDRKFVMVDCQKLMPVKESYIALDSLKINPNHKLVIQGLVEAHFTKRSKEKDDNVGHPTLDLIQGKGQGLFILLHGVPGVGKTATAEAVAQANGKPLFVITCGDLGLTPGEVESALRRIFRLAHTWDCVLLLDEVDTFFQQRSKGDSTLTKNAIVSVFLRVLEYYSGLLFLTTNRPGALDEAFKSRIHLSLYYPPLGFEQTRDIWQLNIDRLNLIEDQRCRGTGEAPLQIDEREILDFGIKQYYEDGSKGRWNGRQIRNAFQIASSLAHFDARKRHREILQAAPDAPAPQPKLDVNHFRMIDRITDEFDRYMQETVGNTDSALAFERDDRADHWGPSVNNRMSGRGSFSPLDRRGETEFGSRSRGTTFRSGMLPGRFGMSNENSSSPTTAHPFSGGFGSPSRAFTGGDAQTFPYSSDQREQYGSARDFTQQGGQGKY